MKRSNVILSDDAGADGSATVLAVVAAGFCGFGAFALVTTDRGWWSWLLLPVPYLVWRTARWLLSGFAREVRLDGDDLHFTLRGLRRIVKRSEIVSISSAISLSAPKYLIVYTVSGDEVKFMVGVDTLKGFWCPALVVLNDWLETK